jgi:hypothetical protein
MKASPRSTRRAFTLTELLMTFPIVTLLLLGTGSAIVVARKSLPDGSSTPSALLSTSRAADLVHGDLQFATSIVNFQASDITFTVADRNGDGQPETIRYYWNGTSGTPLYQQLNGGASVSVADNVYEFSLTYDKRVIIPPPNYGESAEQLLASYSSSTNLGDYSVLGSQWIGTYFKPTLPANAVTWKVTRAIVYLMKTAANGVTNIEIRTADGSNLPTSTMLDMASVNGSSLSSSYTPQQVNYSNVFDIAPSQGLCMVVRFNTGTGSSCSAQYQTSGAAPVQCQTVTTTTGGTSWTAPSGQSLIFSVYGTVTTSTAAANQYALKRVRVGLRSGADPNSRVYTAARILNEPSVTGP